MPLRRLNLLSRCAGKSLRSRIHSGHREVPTMLQTQLEILEAEALKLTPGERAALAQRLLARFDAAAQAGFKAVEIQFPYGWSKSQLGEIAQHAGVEVVLINIPAGDPDKGDRGIGCLPGRVAEFREGVAKAIEYAGALGCKQMNCLAGVAPPDVDPALLHATYVSNLRYAANELALAEMTLLVEPINTRTIPGFYLNKSAQALALMDEVGAANLKLQYDLFHMQTMGDDLAGT